MSRAAELPAWGIPGQVTLTAGRDHTRYSGYEYHIMQCVDEARDDWETLAHASGFKSKASAVSAGRKALEAMRPRT